MITSPKHEAFMIGTSKTRDNTEFELFITTAPIPDLNDKLLVFGRAIKGEDVVQVQSMFFTSDLFLCLLAASFFSNLLSAMFHQEIEEVDTDEHYRPKSPVGIIGVTLKREIWAVLTELSIKFSQVLWLLSEILIIWHFYQGFLGATPFLYILLFLLSPCRPLLIIY